MRTPAVALVVLLALALPSGAAASVTLSNFKVTPSTTQAGGHPDLTIDTAFSLSPTTDDVKSVQVVLPQGLVGDPNAADRCSAAAFAADACPAGSRVGTTTSSVTATILLVDVPQQVTGDVYDLQPHPGEAARLGVVLRPSLPGAQKVFLESPVTVGPQTGYGLLTLFDGLPRTAAGLDIRLDSMQLVLAGRAAHGPFMTNPTGCGPATATATVTSYDEPATPRSATSSFTPTGCDAEPFSPSLSGSIGGPGQTKRGISPALATVVSSRPGDANPSRVQVVLPPSVAANLTATSRACPAPAFAAGTCAPGARMGTATAQSPLLPQPLTGPVILTQDASTGAPVLAVQFGPPVPLTLLGRIDLSPAGLQNTFDGIPDLPLSRFVLGLNGGGGGAGGLLLNLKDLCRGDTPLTLRGEILAHSGRTAPVSAQLAPAACESVVASAGPGKPRGRLTLRFRRGSGTLTASFTSAAALRRVRLALPAALRLPSGRGLRVKGGKPRLRGRTLDISTRGHAVSLRWTGLRPGASLARRLNRHPRLVFVARVTDAGGRTVGLPLGVRPSVR